MKIIPQDNGQYFGRQGKYIMTGATRRQVVELILYQMLDSDPCPTCHKEHCQCYETHKELNE